MFLEQRLGAHLGNNALPCSSTTEFVIMHEHKIAIRTFKDVYLKAVDTLFGKVLDRLQAVLWIACDAFACTVSRNDGFISKINLVGNHILL